MAWWNVVLAIAGGLVVVWVVMVALLWWAQRHNSDRARLREAMRLVPDVVRLRGVWPETELWRARFGSDCGCCWRI